MRHRNPILVVLLLASLLGNVLLAVRLSRSSDPAPVLGRPSLPSERAPSSAALPQLESSLVAERQMNQDLRARIERLETDKKVLALETPGISGKADKVAAFRVKLRKMKKLMMEPGFKDGNGIDPDSMAELSEMMMEFMKMTALRTKEPKLYVDYLQSIYEIGLEGEGTSLTADQSTALKDLLQRYSDGLSQIPAVPSGERLLKGIQLEGATIGRAQGLLTDAQHAALAKGSLQEFASMDMMSIAYVDKVGAAEQIAQQWSSQYQLDASQLPQATLAAQAYVEAMARIDAASKSGDPGLSKPGSPEAYDYREQSVRQQLAALTLLEASMTSDQAERLRTQTMKEIRIMDASGQVQVTTPDK